LRAAWVVWCGVGKGFHRHDGWRRGMGLGWEKFIVNWKGGWWEVARLGL